MSLQQVPSALPPCPHRLQGPQTPLPPPITLGPHHPPLGPQEEPCSTGVSPSGEIPQQGHDQSPLLAGCEHSQHGPGHKTGVWELCWEARTSPGCVRIAKALAGAGSRSCLQSRQGGGVQVGCEKHTQGIPQSIFLLLKKEACTTPDVLEVSESPTAATLGNAVTQEDYCSLGGCAEPEGNPPLSLATNGCPCEHPAGEPQLQEKLKQLQLGRGPAPKAGTAPTDPSCLLTPPTTPLNFDSGSPESPQGTSKGLQDPRRNGMNGTKGSTPEGTERWRCSALGVQD